MNRLAAESSPYLRQHADNPVEWFAWGSAAFDAARSRNQPILLSIGYASCHWCHVMEKESFSDPAVAEKMNAQFVNIKVDREERPDLDDLYMQAVQAFSGGRGGWPMTLFLTPEGAPYFGGTYFPPEQRQGLPSFAQVLDYAHQQWTQHRDKALGTAVQVAQMLAQSALLPQPEDQVSGEWLDMIAGAAVKSMETVA